MRLALLVLVALLVPGCATSPTEGAAPRTFEGIRFEVDVDATHHGVFTVVLFPNETPKTYALMKQLVTSGYYDGREFTRIIPGFVIQQVDRSGGSTDSAERVPLEGGTNVSFSAGALGIARGNDPGSGGPEFFVMDFATSRLYQNYTAWAQVVDGLDVVHAIARVASVRNPAGNAPIPDQVPLAIFDQEAVVPPKITSARMVSVPLPASVADTLPLRVGETQVVSGLRVTPEWPNHLRAGRPSQLTWYVWNVPGNGVDDAPPPDLSQAYVTVADGATNTTLPVKADPADARILHSMWTPAHAGNYTVALLNSTSTLGTTPLSVLGG